MRDSSMRADPRVGVVVLTYNRADTVVQTVARLLALPDSPEIVVVDNGSTDGTAAKLGDRFPTVTVVRLDANYGAAGRNIGVQHCERPYIALCDDDTWWRPGGLRHAADLFDAYPSLAVLTGKVLVGNAERIDPTCLEMARSPLQRPVPLPGPALLGFLAGASMIRREAFLAVGGFEPRLLLGAEERLLALDLASAGWEMAYVEDVIIHHHPSPQRERSRRRRLIARNELWIAWMRRPVRGALARTGVVMRPALRDREGRRGLRDAVRGVPWVLRHRRVIPRHVERQLRLLETAPIVSSPGIIQPERKPATVARNRETQKIPR
jgi:N-acetylglucosaminyl-diphospho-decaprenol L-rhamnosyltransferase